MIEAQKATELDAQVLTCPVCVAQITFRQDDNPASTLPGFEI